MKNKEKKEKIKKVKTHVENRVQDRLNTRVFKKHLKTQILQLALIPLVILGILTGLFSAYRASALIQNSTETHLKALCVSMRDTYSQLNDEPYINKGTESSPKIYKGQYDISRHSVFVDSLFSQASIVSTVFWDNTRIMTSLKDDSGNRLIGTTLDDEKILKLVLKEGQGHFEPDYEIKGHKYYVYYLPLYQEDSDTEIIGMVFVGALADDINREVLYMMLFTLFFIVVIIIAATIVILILTKGITVALSHGVDILNHVAEGNLSVPINERTANRKDEIGNMLYAVSNLRNSLINIVGNIKRSGDLLMDSSYQLDKVATETATTVEQVEKAVDDIAEGANSQAQETQKASEDVVVMGDLLSQTTEQIRVLNENTHSMKRSSNEASDTLAELRVTNGKSIEAINIIYEQTNITNESAKKIQEATHLITSIAEETSLLSLNASIEAARAGEQGRGFAVVAAQIQHLADQSNESATKIEEIIDSLINDSEKAVETMHNVKIIMDNQNKHVEKTEKMFDTVKHGIDQSFVQVNSIAEKTTNLDESRVSIVDIIQNLTAVAEENAASTEETSAASAEVSATVANVSDAANKLKQIATELEKNMSIFKL